MRAAEYVRVSTDHQQYSIANQQAAIAEYAALHGFEIVRTYADQAKSGLDIKRRPGLQDLLEDVLAGRADFRAVFVYDVSRWGRFQDCDEAACYEFLCKRAGIRVHYCAETFTNDESLTSMFLKVIKRTMAAEYLRELSNRVLVGQCSLAARGFKIGGEAGFGLRRLLLDSEGRPKMVLQFGERKSLATERVTYTLGPEEEVWTVQRIFSMYVDQSLGMRTIARLLNTERAPRGIYGPWDRHAIRRILTNPKYTGCLVFNRGTQHLGSKHALNQRDKWIFCPNAFPAIVPQEVFDRTQEELANRVFRRSNERLLEELRTYLKATGRSLPRIRKFGDMACPSTYRYRFGSLPAAYELINYRSKHCSLEAIRTRKVVAAVKAQLREQLRQGLTYAEVRFTEDKGGVRFRRNYFQVETAKCYRDHSVVRWRVDSRTLRSGRGLILIRLLPGNESVKDFMLIPNLSKKARGLTFGKISGQSLGTLHESVDALIDALLAIPRRQRGLKQEI